MSGPKLCVMGAREGSQQEHGGPSYGANRAALGGILQALLLTKHMLFVGFSLTDENFHRLFDNVRRNLDSASHPLYVPPCATLLSIMHTPKRKRCGRQHTH